MAVAQPAGSVDGHRANGKQRRKHGSPSNGHAAPVEPELDKRRLLSVLVAFRKGDFAARMPIGLSGIDGKIADTLNDLMEFSAALANELQRVSQVVGEQGRTSQRASLGEASGPWASSLLAVNNLIANLVQPTTETARVIGAVARGDLSQEMALEFDSRPLRGEFLSTAKSVNRMVVQLSSFASEVTRVAREVGTEGKLGGQARVKGAAGTWQDLTESVNQMAGNLTAQVRNIADVTKAVASGDLSKKITVDTKGEILELKNTLNTMVDQLNSFASEVTRVAREVGTEGKLGGQAQVRGLAGVWSDLTENVNLMAGNLTAQVRNIAAVTTAVAMGDLSKKITVDVKGEILELKNTLNAMVDQLNAFASEVTRVARDVGTEGKLGGQAVVRGAAGVWKDLTDNVNLMAGNLTSQVRNIAEVATAVATGDLSKKITVDVKGEILELKNTLNTMVDQLNSFASEVTRVAREVGTEGKLGGQAQVKGVAGVWYGLTENVNLMAGNLTAQVRNVAEVATAVATGDLSRKITVDVKGEILELKNTLNTMVDQLNSFASEVTRVAREVGTEGKLGGQADVKGVAGVWRGLTENVNLMAGNLTAQVRNIAAVTTAVANGDLSKKITVDVKGEILELKNTLNTMVDQLNSFASEVTRVAREVGTEGKLGGQAEVRDAAGVWKDLTDNVNLMAGNLTSQVRNIAEVATAVATGDLSKKITVDVKGEILELKNTLNTMVDQLNSFASEVTRVAREVGTEGKLGGQAQVKGVAGVWSDLTDNVNLMAGNLTSQVRNIAAVTTAVATGDLSKKITVDVKGEILELKNTLNTMVDQLNSFASEVTRVARDVGTEGKLGGQASVPGVAGVWKDLTDNVNSMASNLTDQVRGIAKVVTAVANGDLKRKLTVEAKGEIAALADTINGMIDTLATFADQVTTVAREVGVEGQLGGQASVPGAAGTWKDLTDNVNQLAANLTTQMRAIAEVATAVTTGDLTRSISVEASGEVAALKDNINEMIRHLRDTTQKNSDQDWLKGNLAKFSRMLQGQKDLLAVGRLILSELAPVVYAQHGVFYILDGSGEEPELHMLASYAHRERKNVGNRFKLGEGLVGQCALEKDKITLTTPPDYVRVSSGLGEAAPMNVIVLPVLFEGQVKAVIELASFERFNATQEGFLDQLAETIGIVLNTIEANSRTEDLLKQSQSLASELGTQQEELRQTNQQLGDKAQLLAQQNAEVERKNREIDKARASLEEKAAQLALTSKYKSEFLANMSHELRTPLNSLLILSDELAKNPVGNLTDRQTEYASTIHSSGTDLLMLINDILDLSKIESGTVSLDVGEVRFNDLSEFVERTFRHVAEAKGLDFALELGTELPRGLLTDSKRLHQVVKNLLSNAFKFTDRGGVKLAIGVANAGWSREVESLNRTNSVIAFAVCDTGIGIPTAKHQIIFEAFQQADGSTSRRYGGTGLGLAISREIATLLGGDLRVASNPGEGSTFTLYLPISHISQKTPRRAHAMPIDLREAAVPSPPFAVNASAEEVPVLDRVPDDRDTLQPNERVVLIVDNDDSFAALLLDAARQRGWRGVVASRGSSAVALARDLQPDAVTLDIRLPDIDGWRVLRTLKADPATRHIPVVIVSTDDDAERGQLRGALGVLAKPISRREDLDAMLGTLSDYVDRSERRVLWVTPPGDRSPNVPLLSSEPDVQILCAHDVAEAEEALDQDCFDCVLIEPGDGAGFEELMRSISRHDRAADRHTQVFCVEREAANGDHRDAWPGLRSVSDAQVLDALAAHLHLRADRMAPTLRAAVDLGRAQQKQNGLAGRTILIVDDDIRNIFAMTTVLEKHAIEVVAAETGQAAIEVLRSNPAVDLVLMDVMMPGMDGYDTMREIRLMPEYRSVPIIAVTAKAMKGDREKTLQAGAWDYLAKPVDVDRMMSILQAWLQN